MAKRQLKLFKVELTGLHKKRNERIRMTFAVGAQWSWDCPTHIERELDLSGIALKEYTIHEVTTCEVFVLKAGFVEEGVI